MLIDSTANISRRLVLITSLAGASLVAIASCARTDVGGGPASASTYGAGICNYLARCAPSLVRSQFGDVPACVSAFTSESAKLFAAPGANLTKRQLDACIVKTESASCDDDIESLSECDFKGALLDGATCSSGIQCATGSCFKTSIDGVLARCGVCSRRVDVSGSCVDAACAPGLECMSGACARPGEIDARCDEARGCKANLACVQGVCVAMRRLDEPCGGGGGGGGGAVPPCNEAQGLGCVGGTCRTVVAKIGGSCEVHPFCETSFCANDHKCTAFYEEGARCERSSQCAFPLECRVGSCIRTDPVACQ